MIIVEIVIAAWMPARHTAFCLTAPSLLKDAFPI